MTQKKATEVARRLHRKVTKKYRIPKTMSDVLRECNYINPDGSFNQTGFIVAYQSQLKRTHDAFKTPKTMLEVAHETGIERANICRYVRTMRMRCVIFVYKVGKCPITKHKACFLTTDKSLIQCYQQSLFEEDSNELY